MDIICNRNEDIDKLIPYINRPVYIKGFCWNRSFDGWVIIYDQGRGWLSDINLAFDYRGKTYPVGGFLPSRFELQLVSSSNDNAFFKGEMT